MNRLSRYCEGLMEAAWLSALIVTPLMMSLSGNVANIVKIGMLRSFILIGFGAWGIQWLSSLFLNRERASLTVRSTWLAGAVDLLRKPLALPVAGLAFVYLLSSIFSLSPLLSIQGSYTRFEGIYTLFSYLLLFILLAAHLRRREQVERFISVLAAASFVVDFYAILQHAGLDPIPWIGTDVVSRPISTIGNPIFVAAFLNLTLFVFLGRVILAFQAFRAGGVSRWEHLLRMFAYGLVSILNLVAGWYTSSRGPLLGLAAGLGTFVLLLLLYWQRRRLQIVFLGLMAVFLLLLAQIWIPNSPLIAPGSPFASSLGRLAEPMGGYTARIRVLIWEGAAGVVLPHAPITYPDKSEDRWNPIRPLIGYGAETLYLAFPGHYTPEMYVLEEQYVEYDRAHNEFWNTAAFFGVFGLVAEYGLFLSAFFFGLRWLGLIRTRFERDLYWWLALVGGFVGGVGSVYLVGLPFLGLGIPLGLLAGLLGILFRRILRPLPQGAFTEFNNWQVLTMIGILSALVSYYVEVLFGIAMVMTSTLFWGYLAIMLVLGRSLLQGEASEQNPVKGSRPATVVARRPMPSARASAWADLREPLRNATGLVILLITLASGFIVSFHPGDNASIILINALTSIQRPSPHTSFGMLGLFFCAIVFAAVLFQLDFPARPNRKMAVVNILATLGIALISLLLFGVSRAGQLANVRSVASQADVAVLASSSLAFYNIFYAIMIFLCLAWAATLQPDTVDGLTGNLSRLPGPALNWPLALGSAFIFCFVIFCSVVFNLHPMQADVLMSQVKSENAGQRHEAAQALYSQVLKLMPVEPFYLVNAEKVYSDLIITSLDVQRKEQYFQTGLGYLDRAVELAPLQLDMSMALARFYRLGGDMTSDQVTRNFRFYKANSYFATALNANPIRADYWLAWAEFLSASGDLQGAYAKLNSALAVDPTNDAIYPFLGDLYMVEANTQSDPQKNTALYTQALQAYQKQVDLLTQRGANPAEALVDMAQVYDRLAQYENTRATLLRASELGVGEFQWFVYQKIAEASAKLDDQPARREYLQKALDAAPADQKAALQAELDKLPQP